MGDGATEISIQTLENTNDPTYEFEALCDGEALADFGGGTAEVAIAYQAESWADPDTILVEQVLDDGSAVLVPSSYDAESGTVTFTTEHFSCYRIVRDYGVKAFQATAENGSLSVSFQLDAPYAESAAVMIAVYDANGRMLQLRQAALDNYDEASGLVDTQSVAVSLRDDARADHVKVFLLDKSSMPVLAVYRNDL